MNTNQTLVSLPSDTSVSWNGHEVSSARDVRDLLNSDALADISDVTDAPAWGGPEVEAIAQAACRRHTVWSWDADGVVVGGDGAYNTPEFRFLPWSEVQS